MALYGRARNARLLVISLVMLSLLTITIDYRGGQSGPLEVAGQAALSVVGALQSAMSKVVRPVGNFFTGLGHLGSLQAENQRLKERVQTLERQAGQGVSLERENGELRRLLGLRRSLGLEGKTADVIGESVSNFEWSVTIDRGSTDGIGLNMPVVNGEGLVGHVVQVAPGWSRVQLIIDPDSAVAARLASSGQTGLVTGRRDRDLRMELVSPEAKVFPDEQVVTSGYQGGLYPSGIVIGVVSHVYQPPGSLTKLIDVRPAVDFSSLQFVLVVTKR